MPFPIRLCCAADAAIKKQSRVNYFYFISPGTAAPERFSGSFVFNKGKIKKTLQAFKYEMYLRKMLAL